MSRIDTERIERAKKNRRNQLIEWEKYDSSYSKINSNHEKRKGQKGVIFKPNIIFLEAAARDDVAEVSRLLEEHISPNVKNEDGLTALHQCCIDNSIEMCTLLLDNGADVNAVDNELWTPLHAAATCGHKDLCELLISRGAHLLAINIDGNMPYDMCDDDNTLILVESEMAARNITQQQIDEIRQGPEREMLEDMQMLNLEGESLSVLDSQGAAPIHIACACGYQDVVRYLLRYGVDPELPDREGWLPIHIAVCWSQIEIVELLVAYGANIYSTTKSGQTVFSISDSPELHQRLNEIWEQREELKRSSKLQEIEIHSNRSSLRRKTSSVSRCSTRQKRDKKLSEALLEKKLGEQVEARIFEDKISTDDDISVSPPPTVPMSPLQTETRNSTSSSSSSLIPVDRTRVDQQATITANGEHKRSSFQSPPVTVMGQTVSPRENQTSSLPIPPPRTRKPRQNGVAPVDASPKDSTISVTSSNSSNTQKLTAPSRRSPSPMVKSTENGVPPRPIRGTPSKVQEPRSPGDLRNEKFAISPHDNRRKNTLESGNKLASPLSTLRTDSAPILGRNYNSEQNLNGPASISSKRSSSKGAKPFECCKVM